MIVGVERSDASGVPLRQRRHLIGRPEEPTMGMIGVLLNGIVGIVSEPVRYPAVTLSCHNLSTLTVFFHTPVLHTISL